jgi:hypothetical protein
MTVHTSSGGIFAAAYQHNVSVDGDESRPDVNESPDLLEVYVPTAGIVQAQLVLPNTIAPPGVFSISRWCPSSSAAQAA